jgi:hypothetical protein
VNDIHAQLRALRHFGLGVGTFGSGPEGKLLLFYPGP